MTQESLSESELAALASVAIGSDESAIRAYSLRHKTYLERGVPMIAFNGWGYLFGFGWFLHRKIWPVVILAMLVFVVIRAIDVFRIHPIDGALSIIVWIAVGNILAGLFGHQIYFKWILMLVDHGLNDGKRGAALEDFLRRELGTIQYFRR